MSDYNSSLPVRTENAGDIAVKVVDSLVPSQQLTINPDGSINTTISATDLDIRDLAFATDKVDVSGSDVTATVTATDLDTRDLTFATDKVDVSGSSVVVTATDLDIRNLSHAQDSVKVGDGTDFMAVNTDGSINVVVVEDPGLEIVNYSTSTVAAGSSANHDYTSTTGGKLFQVLASGSGKMKIEIQVETGNATGTFNTIATAFNSASNPNIDVVLKKHKVVPAGARVRIIRTNRDQQSQDLFSTIVMVE